MATGESARVRLLHMRDEIKSLSDELLGLDLEIYRESYALRRITERAIQIISEAARALPEELRARCHSHLARATLPICNRLSQRSGNTCSHSSPMCRKPMTTICDKSIARV
jgi:uncharacterized membrane protein YccC